MALFGSSKKKRKTEVAETNTNEEDDARTWRGDPAETFSDWRIEITTKGDATAATTYHVHKFMLARGDRKSNYFVNLFRNNFQESNASTSQIELDHAALAEAFPPFLDYIYGKQPDWESLIQSNTKIIVALGSLAEYFAVSQLRTDVEDFCRQSMNIENVYPFYEWATILVNSKIKEEASKLIGKEIEDVAEESPLVTGTGIATDLIITLWVDVVQHVESTDFLELLYLSRLIAKICETMQDEIDLETFQKLTDESKLPHIDYLSGITLVETEERLLQLQASSTTDEKPLTSLQKRCIRAISNLSVSEKDKSRLVKFLETRSKAFVLELFLVTKGKSQRPRINFRSGGTS